MTEMHCSPRGLLFIERFEGGRSSDGLFHAYWDPTGRVWTIGFGQTKNIRQGMVWTLKQALDDLARSLREDGYETAVRSVNPQNQNVFDAWCSIVYNLGTGAAQWDIGDFTRAGKLNEAAAALMQYNHSGGIVLGGLTTRRHDEGVVLTTPWVDPDPRHKFDHRKRHIRGLGEPAFSEYDTVIEYDRERRWWKRFGKRLTRLKQNCGLFADRLDEQHQVHGHWAGDQRWRRDQLRLRQKGKRVFK